MKRKLSTLAAAIVSGIMFVSTAPLAYASCTTDCYQGCYQAFGDEPQGWRYLSCLADCNTKCLPNPGAGI